MTPVEASSEKLLCFANGDAPLRNFAKLTPPVKIFEANGALREGVCEFRWRTTLNDMNYFYIFIFLYVEWNLEFRVFDGRGASGVQTPESCQDCFTNPDPAIRKFLATSRIPP